jgi:hypothetical protein
MFIFLYFFFFFCLGSRKKITLAQLVDLYRGSASKGLEKFRSGNVPYIGDGKKDLSKTDAERAVHIAIRDGILDENIERFEFFVILHLWFTSLFHIFRMFISHVCFTSCFYMFVCLFVVKTHLLEKVTSTVACSRTFSFLATGALVWVPITRR